MPEVGNRGWITSGEGSIRIGTDGRCAMKPRGHRIVPYEQRHRLAA
jgi:hypothetical protein